MCRACIDVDVLPQNASFSFDFFCSTLLKEGIINLKTSLPAGECCPICGRSREECNFILKPVKVM